MAHEILGNRFMARKVPAWHALGYVVEDLGSATHALEMIDDDIVIDKLEYGVNVPGYGMWNPDNRYVLIRRPTKDDPQPRHFGEVGEQYTVLQNMQVAQLVDILLDGTKGKWTLDTVGILRKGETIFFALKDTEGFTVAGDDMGMFVGITDQRNGGSAVDIAMTPVRYVCANTVRFGLEAAKERITIRHHADMFGEVSWRMNIIAQAVAQGNSMKEALQGLTKINLTLDAFTDLLTDLFPIPTAPATMELRTSGNTDLMKRGETAAYQHAYRVEKMKETRNDIVENFTYLAEKYGNTGWAGMNAITGWIDHQSGKDTDNGLRVMSERTLSESMDKLRTRAYKGILKIGKPVKKAK